MAVRGGRYGVIFEHIFLKHWVPGATEVLFDRDEIAPAAAACGIKTPKNLGDVVYTFRYRSDMPTSIAEKAPDGQVWIVRGRGDAKYAFVLVPDAPLVPDPHQKPVKVPDATPGIIARHVMSSEQALLAKVRYNRLIDLVTGIVCYSLQNHLRTKVADVGQIETDEVYLGVSHSGAQYVIPVEAKGGADRLSIVQLDQDLALCKERFPGLIPLIVGTQFQGEDVAMMVFSEDPDTGSVAKVDEARYRLVPPEKISPEDLASYRAEASRRG